jgi:HEAT repeat protein
MISSALAGLTGLLKLVVVAVAIMLVFGLVLYALGFLDNPKDNKKAWIEEQTKVLDTNLDQYARKMAAERLGDMGPAARSAVPVLIQALKDWDFLVRHRAAEALGKIGADPETVVPALTASLGDKHPIVRAMAAESLGKFGPAAASALPTLRKQLSDAHPQAQDRAARAIEAIAPTQPAASGKPRKG